MSDIDDRDRTPDEVAADYVMGLLDQAAAADAERRATSDPTFARAVKEWRVRLAEFDASSAEIAPSDTLWQRIETDLGASSAQATEARPSILLRVWNSIDALRMTASLTTAAALLCAGLAVYFQQIARNAAATKPVFVAVLVSDATRQAGAVVSTFADGHAELLPLVDIDVPSGRALQVWTLWDRTVGPKPIGLIDRARSIRLDLDRLPITAPDQLFEITLEPAAGSPIGRPTGPILYKGTTSRTL